jgi:hypothetical protein
MHGHIGYGGDGGKSHPKLKTSRKCSASKRPASGRILGRKEHKPLGQPIMHGHIGYGGDGGKSHLLVGPEVCALYGREFGHWQSQLDFLILITVSSQ